MRASLSTMRYIGQTDKDLLAGGIDELTKLATNRLGGLEGYEEYGKRFDGIVVAKIIRCVPHDNSDHLSVCMVDDGGVVKGVERDAEGLVQVVCGAPNAREGLIVAWIPPGAIVPKSLDESEPFTLEKREIRGKLSNGMLASPSELGLFDNHDGILEIDSNEVGQELVTPGTDFKKLYNLNDVLMDFENKMFTHRPDCFGQIGLARELAAIQGLKYTSPEWYWKVPKPISVKDREIHVFNDVPDVVPRLMSVVMSNVKVGESPVWLKSFLTRMGGKPVNNVVDISNYIMHLTAQPTHAYDLGKIDGATLGARMAKKGEKLSLLNGKTIALTEDDIVIADKLKAIGLAGIMGGSETEVDGNTTDILLEVASFDMYTIRRSAMRHGLFTDAFTRFSKGQSPLQNDRVIYKFMELLSELTGATQASDVYDTTSPSTEQMLDWHSPHDLVKTSVGFVNSRLGTDLKFDEISEILHRVEMAVIPGDGDDFEVGAPYFRTDIELPEDVVEEIGRLHGFDLLATKLPVRTTKPAPKNVQNEFKGMLRNQLSSAGANEVLSYSFVHGDLLHKTGIEDIDKWAFHLRNALSPDLQYYRTSLLPSLLVKAHPNLKSDMVRGDDNEFALFEIGKAHVKQHLDDEGLPTEFERLAFMFVADEKTAMRNYSGSAYFQAKKYLSMILDGQAEYKPLDSNEYPITSPYQIGRSAMVHVNGVLLGVIGELRSGVRKALKLPDFCAGFELDLGLLMANLRVSNYQPISTFPKTQQDITLKVSQDVTYEDLRSNIWKSLMKIRTDRGYDVSLGPRDIFAKSGEDTKNITFRLWLWHPNKTLKTDEVNAILNELTEVASKSLKAERV